MPHTAYEDDELGLTPGWDEHLDPNIRKEIRQARITVQQNVELTAKVTQYERERTLARAGIPQDKRGDAFARVYEGPTDDPETVKAAYEELFGASAAPAGAGTTGDGTAGDQAIHDAGSAGTSTGTLGTVDLAEAIKGAKDADEVRAILDKAGKQNGLFGPGQLVPRNVDEA